MDDIYLFTTDVQACPSWVILQFAWRWAIEVLFAIQTRQATLAITLASPPTVASAHSRRAATEHCVPQKR